MGRKSTSTAVSKVSSTSAPAVSSMTASTQKSSLLKSAFAPSQFQLHLFASVLQSFDSQQLRIHDTISGRLRCQHESKPGTRITSLDWGYYGAAYRDQRQTPSKKKRKRDLDPSESAVIAYGTSSSEICLFSPAEGKIVGVLTGGHQRGVKDFKFAPIEFKEGWSIGEDSKLVQWDLVSGQAIRTISLPDPAITVLAVPSTSLPQILCASSTPFAVNLDSSTDYQIDRFDSFKNSVHSIVRSEAGASLSSDAFIAADTDRYLNIYDIQKKRLVRTLVAGSGVAAVDLFKGPVDATGVSGQQLLSVVTKEGTVELFLEPFAVPKQENGDLKSSRKSLTRKASAQVRLLNHDGKGKQVAIFAASIQGSDLVIASTEGGVDLTFQKIRWQDEGNGELLFDGIKEVVKTRSASTLNTATLNGVKDLGKSHVDESRTVVVNGATGGPYSDAIAISSSEGESDESADEADLKEDASEDEEDEASAVDEEMAEAAKGDDSEAEDEEMGDAASGDESPTAEPTFGEVLASRHPGTISIADNLAPEVSNVSISGREGITSIPSGMSLGTVLTQSLRTNDTNLLEACLHTLDINIVKNTIQRLDSSLAGILLSKLAERLASRPGRYGHLITWVQWTCIAHGGAIAAQPDVAAKVRSLYQVLTQRSRTLDNLLLLKGKLDMLDAQLKFRKQLASQRPPKRDDQDEPGMIYLEGEDNWDSTDDEDLDEDISRPLKKIAHGKGRGKATKRALEDLIGEEESSEEEELLPITNGDLVTDEDEDDESDEEQDEDLLLINGHNGGLVDDEAEVSGAEDSDPDDEGDEGVDVESSDDTASSDDEEDEVDEDDEEDSEMDSFINDGSISLADEDGDIDIPGDDDEENESVRPQSAPAPAPVPSPPASSRKTKSKKPSKSS